MTKLALAVAALALATSACGRRGAAVPAGSDTTEIARPLTGPSLTPEFGMDNPTTGPSQASASASAFDGSRFFVVWQDRRQPATHIYGTRVDAAGAVLDHGGISIGTTTAAQGNPAIAYGGGQYLVAWEQTPSSSTTPKIYVSRVSVDGVVLDPGGVAVSTNTGNRELAPAIAFDGTNFLVVWGVGMGSNGRIAGARISAAGKLLDTTSIVVSSISSPYTEAQSQPAVIFDGTNYLVAWQDDRSSPWDIYANHVTPAGAPLDGTGFVVANTTDQELQPAIGFAGGGNALIVWTDWPADSSGDTVIYGRFVGPAGTLLDTAALTLANAAGTQRDPAVTFDGTSYLVVWGDQRVTNTSKLYATRVSTDGAVMDPAGLPLIGTPASQSTPALVTGGGQTLLTWTDSTVRAARLDLAASSKDGGGFPLSAAPNTQVDPDAAFDGTNYLVVWTDSRLGTPSIVGTRVSRQGAVLDVGGIQISSGAVVQQLAAVAWNGSSYLVAWGGSKAGARRVGADGTVLDSADIDLPGLSFSDVASNGTDFLVVGGSTASTGDIAGLRVGGGGALLDAAPFTINAATGDQYLPMATFDGTHYVVVWLDYGAGSHPFGARVTSAGQVLDPNGIQLTVPTGTEYQSKPDVTSDGVGTSFAVWEDSRGYAIRGTRLDTSGNVLDPAGAMVVMTPSGYDMLSAPAIAFDGTNYLVGQVDHVLNTSFSSVSYNLFADRVTPAGAGLGGLQVAMQASATLPAAVASDRMGGTIFTYVLPDSSSGFPVSRVRARIFTEDAPTGGCSSSVGCTTGFCVDGVCCDTACGGGVATDCVACSVVAGGATNGTCGPVVNGRACNDGNACTTIDTCAAGVCVGAGSAGCTPDGGSVDAKPDAVADGAGDVGADTGADAMSDHPAGSDAADAGGDAPHDAAGGAGGAAASGGRGGATGGSSGGGAGGASGGSSGGGAGGGSNSGSSGGCGCAVGDTGGRTLAPIGLLALLLIRRRRRVRACRC
jgi:MYXO-CTERM domain-containing protein